MCTSMSMPHKVYIGTKSAKTGASSSRKISIEFAGRAVCDPEGRPFNGGTGYEPTGAEARAACEARLRS